MCAEQKTGRDAAFCFLYCREALIYAVHDENISINHPKNSKSLTSRFF